MMTQHENLAAAAEAAAAAAAAAAARSRVVTHPENIISSSRRFLAIILLQPIPRSSCPILHFLLPLTKPPSSNRLLLLLPTRVGRLPLISKVLLQLPSQQNPCCCPPASTACPWVSPFPAPSPPIREHERQSKKWRGQEVSRAFTPRHSPTSISLQLYPHFPMLVNVWVGCLHWTCPCSSPCAAAAGAHKPQLRPPFFPHATPCPHPIPTPCAGVCC